MRLCGLVLVNRWWSRDAPAANDACLANDAVSVSYCASAVQLFCEVKHSFASIPVSELRTNSSGIPSWLEHKIIHAKNHPFVVVGARANLLPVATGSVGFRVE